MGGAAKSAGKSFSTVFKNPGKANFRDYATVIGGPAGLGIGGTLLMHALKRQKPNLATMQGGQSPTDLLANTGGAPVLANIILGVDPEEALAGFLGIPRNQISETLSEKDLNIYNQTLGQLKSIQSNRQIRDQAVQKVIDDYPNLMQQTAQARAQAGVEFDDVTKGYMKQALEGAAARLNTGAGISSGAANEAFSRVGGEMGLQRLGYQGEREATDYSQRLAGFNARLGEANALRDFQNTMLQSKVQEGFSANQANLGRIQQTQLFNAGAANDRALAQQQGKNAMWGALGSLGGAAIGGMLGGPPGAAAGSSLGNQAATGSFNPQAPKTYTTSYGRTMGGGQ